MDIRYHKKGCLTIKNKDVDILIGADFGVGNNYEERVWVANPKGDVSDFGSVPDGKILINGVGEYEAGGVDIIGFKYGKDERSYLLTIDDFRVAILFEGGQTDELIDKFESLDVLVVLNPPLGAEKQLLSLVTKTGVNFLILTGTKEENRNCLDTFDREDIVPVEKISIKQGQEMVEGLDVVLLSA